MSGFRDSLKGQYYGELVSGFSPHCQGEGLGREEAEQDQWGVGQLYRRGQGQGRGGERGESWGKLRGPQPWSKAWEIVAMGGRKRRRECRGRGKKRSLPS